MQSDLSQRKSGLPDLRKLQCATGVNPVAWERCTADAAAVGSPDERSDIRVSISADRLYLDIAALIRAANRSTGYAVAPCAFGLRKCSSSRGMISTKLQGRVR